MQFSTIVGGDENWRMQTKKNLVVPSSMKWLDIGMSVLVKHSQ
jgi:hypothetical protein